MLALSVLCGWLATLATDVSPAGTGFWPLVLGFLVAVALLVAWSARRGEALGLLPLVSVFFALAFALGAVYYRSPRVDGGSGALVGFRGSYTPEGLALALAIALLGWLCLSSGFLAARFMRAARRIPRTDVAGAELALVAAIVLALGLLARAYLVTNGLYFRYATSANEGAVGQFSTLAQILANLPLLVIALVAVQRHRTGRWRALLWLLVAAELAWALPSGERVRIVGLGLVLLVTRYYGSPRPFPWRGLVVALVVAIFVVFPFGALYRGPGGASGYQVDPVQRLGITTSQFIGQSPGDAVSGGIEETFSRFSDIASLATLTTQGRAKYPYDATQTLRIWAQAFVPRFVMSGKENPGTIGNQFGLRYGVLYYRSLNTSSIAVTWIGDLYGAFGFLGITVLAAGLGVCLRGLDEYFHDRRTNTLGLAIYATMLGQFLLGLESSVAVGFLQSLKEVFVYVVVSTAVVLTVRLTSARRVKRA